MKERLKKLRKALDLTQQEFADRIGISRGSVATYETRDGNPGNSVINLICREFNVNEQWLRTGAGDMFAPMVAVDDPVERLCRDLHATQLDAEIIRAYFKIDERIREPFVRKLLELVRATPGTTAPAVTPAPVEADTERENFLKTAAAQYDSEKEPDTPASSVSGSGVV